ncbi:MAG: hypothetical protein AAGI30_06735 [Planctomycetota bacterium]
MSPDPTDPPAPPTNPTSTPRRSPRRGVFPILILLWVAAIAAVFTLTTCLKLAGPESLRVTTDHPAPAP